MSVKIKVSYQRPDELRRLLSRLGTDVESCKVAKNQEGRFLKAYILLTERSQNKQITERCKTDE
jgi:hypothetical protein